MRFFDGKRRLAYWNELMTWEDVIPLLKKRPGPEVLGQSPTMRRYEVQIYDIATVFLVVGLSMTDSTTLIWPCVAGVGVDLVLIVVQIRNVLLSRPQPRIIARRRIEQIIVLCLMGLIICVIFVILVEQGFPVHF